MFWDFDGRNVAMMLWREACLTTEKIPFSVVFVFQAMLTYHNSDVRKNKLNNKKRSFSSEKLPSDFLAGKNQRMMLEKKCARLLRQGNAAFSNCQSRAILHSVQRIWPTF